MKSILAIAAFILFNSHLLAQNCYIIKLVDSYSSETIEIAQIKSVYHKKHHLDSVNNLIYICQPKEKKLSIIVANYEGIETEIVFKNKRADTLLMKMKPVDSIIQNRFNELFIQPKAKDTLIFYSLHQLKEKLHTYLNYLSVLKGQCENGMCNYSSKFVYNFQFTNSAGYYQISSITKTQPLEYTCAPLDDALNNLKINFPIFQLAGENEVFRCVISINL
jgi:hypothetical protein